MTQPGTDVATQGSQPVDGLEDFDPNSAAVPRLNIVHKDGVFVDSLSGMQYSNLYGVILGMIKQRGMWHEDTVDNMKPQCKSQDSETGYPNMVGPRQEDRFPWYDVNFTPNDLPTDEYGRTVIPCATCPFSEWTKGTGAKAGKNIPPRCSERYTFPMFFSDQPIEGPSPVLPFVGIVTFQKSGITPSRNYLSAFSRTKQSLYTALTHITLVTAERGAVKYSTPVFRRTGDTAPEDYERYSKELGMIREFLRRPPRPADGLEKVEPTPAPGAVSTSGAAGIIDAVVVQQTTTPAPVVQQPVPPPAPAQSSGLITQQIQQPVAPAVPQQPAPAPAPAPVVQQPVQATVAGMTGVADDDDDNLPF